jgi:hypothetical protein
VSFEQIRGSAGGWFDQQARRIVVDAGAKVPTIRPVRPPAGVRAYRPRRRPPLKVSPVAYAEEPPGGRRRVSDSRGPLTA